MLDSNHTLLQKATAHIEAKEYEKATIAYQEYLADHANDIEAHILFLFASTNGFSSYDLSTVETVFRYLNDLSQQYGAQDYTQYHPDLYDYLAVLRTSKEVEGISNMCEMGAFETAKTYCMRMIYENAKNPYPYVFLVRIASQNYTVFDDEDIDSYILLAESKINDEFPLLAHYDKDYADYQDRRDDYFAKKQQKEGN